jgi:hypothetical protein
MSSWLPDAVVGTGPLPRPGASIEQPMEWSARQILGADQEGDKLRHIRTEWAPRAPLAAALQLHEDTFARRARAAGVQTQIEVTAGHRCRVLYAVADVRRMMLGEESER